jgi:DNA (cytosine-5)-methyltransferase 1
MLMNWPVSTLPATSPVWLWILLWNKLTTRAIHGLFEKILPREWRVGMEKSFSTLRQEAGLTVKACAEELAISVSTAYRYESGESSPRASELRVLVGLGAARKKPGKQEGNHGEWFTFIDLFAGIGGLRRGFDAIGGKCVFTSEWDKYAVETYRANYKCDHDVAGDITKIDASDIPRHDVLLAGFPCQPFSIAGVSKKNALNRERAPQICTVG